MINSFWRTDLVLGVCTGSSKGYSRARARRCEEGCSSLAYYTPALTSCRDATRGASEAGIGWRRHKRVQACGRVPPRQGPSVD